MSGAACAKVIIDNGRALNRATECMSASILLAEIRGVSPTEDEEKEFLTASEVVAKCAAKIEKRVRSDSGF